MRSNKEMDLLQDLKQSFSNDYESGYICDVIAEISDAFIDIYNHDLLQDAWELYSGGWYEEAMQEFGSTNDLIKDLQQAQYIRNTTLLYDDLEECITQLVIRLLEERNALTLKNLDGFLEENTYDNNDQIEDIINDLENYLESEDSE